MFHLALKGRGFEPRPKSLLKSSCGFSPLVPGRASFERGCRSYAILILSSVEAGDTDVPKFQLVPKASTQESNLMRYDRPNDPNAGRLVESLRHLGYGNYEAIADLVDNSIDAEARYISIRVQQRNNQPYISIGDRGSGMARDIVDQAMRLGSMTSRDLNSDLGKFGMGLVTASLSIAKRCHVITRTDEGCWSSAWDVDEVLAKNAFLKHLDTATPE
jgi:hypothetical protein